MHGADSVVERSKKKARTVSELFFGGDTVFAGTRKRVGRGSKEISFFEEDVRSIRRTKLS